MKKNLLFILMAVLLSLPMRAKTAPAQIELSENQRIMGHFDSDAITTEGAKVKTTGKVSIGTILESEELDIFIGGKITAFRVGLAESTPVTKVFVVPVSAGGAYGTMVSWPCEADEVGWNVITLPTPYQLEATDGGRLLIGFEYEQTSTNKPLAVVPEGDIYDTYYYKKAGQMYRWTTAGFKSLGNLCVQCIVEKDNFPSVLIKANGLEAPRFVNIGDDLQYTFQVRNRGIKPLNAGELSFDVMLDGEKVATISNPEDIDPATTYTMQEVLETGDLAVGSHTLTVCNAAAGEESLDYVYPMSATFVTMNGVYPRQKHLVEQFTSTYCTYCPLGNSMLTILTNQRDDVIWVGIHGELNGGLDPYMSDQADSIMAYMGNDSYPSGAFDRATGWESPNQLVNSLGYYEQYHQEVADELGLFFDKVAEDNPTFAAINIDPVVDLNTREAVITVYGDISPDIDLLLGEGNKLTVYITEDSLVARQVNNGVWIPNYVHNGVFRCALGSVKGVDFNMTEDGYSNEFTITIPDDWNVKNLNVVAFVSRPITNGATGKITDMQVNNAEKVRLVNIPGGIEETLATDDAVPVEYYDVMGHKLDAPIHGINIVRMSDGTARKVLVK